MKPASACEFESKGRKGWLYDEYSCRRKDNEGRPIGEGENHWTGAESMEWYKGQFTRDTINGYGDYRWRHQGPENLSVSYEGYFLANRLHGYGTMSYPDGRTFRGLYYKDMRWGPGVQYLDMHTDVGFWRGNQLVRLAWRPGTTPIAPDLPSGANGKAFVDQFRTLLAKDIKIIGKTNSAVDLLRECGMDPMEASKRWTKLYATNCTDLRSPGCDVNAFENHYYKGRVHSLRPLASDENSHELADNNRLYYAWNNNKMMVHMMRHSFKHYYQRSQVFVDLETILNGPRNKFRPPGSNERDARIMLMCSYLGRIEDVVQYVNESGIHPDVTDNLGNSALVYATCGEEIDLIHFLVEAGANVNGANDSCCTPLSVALMRFACARREVPFHKITHVVVPNSKQNLSALSMKMSSTNTGGKRANGSPDGKQLSPPIDTCNTRGVKNALPAFEMGVRSFLEANSLAEDAPIALDWIIRRVSPASQRPSMQSRRSILLQKSITHILASAAHVTTPTKKLSRKAMNFTNTSSLTSLSEPTLSTTKANIHITRQKAKRESLMNDTYDSDDSIFGENKLYKAITHEYMIKINKVFPTKSSTPTYLFSVENVLKTLDTEEEEEFSLPLNTRKDVSVVWQGGSKTAIDSLSVLVPDRCPQMMLTIMQLLNEGADPKLVRCPQPAMLIAVAADCPDLIRYLASHGADVNETFPAARNYNALEIVMSRSLSLENLVLMRALLDSRADVNHRFHYNKESGPTLMHVLVAKKTENIEEEEILESTLNLLLKNNCNPFVQFRGYTPVDMILKRRLHLLNSLIKMPNINLNQVINDNNETILVKMFSVPFFQFYHWRLDLCPMITELLLRGADPLIACQFEGNTYENLFEILKENSKVIKCAAITVRRPSNQIGQGDATVTGSKKNDKSKKKESLKMMPNLQEDFRSAIDLLSSCVRMMHVKWLQAKLVQELVHIVYKYKHRWWHIIIKEHKNQAATAIWVTPQRFIEIWDILKTTKKKVYNDEVVLKSTLCILYLYKKRKVSFPMNLTVSATVKDEIQSDVRKIMTEHKIVKLKANDVQKALQNNDVYVKSELQSRKTNKYNICFECCVPLQMEQGIPCTLCQSVLFCTTDCVNTNVGRYNCHLCNELEGQFNAESGCNGSMAVSGF